MSKNATSTTKKTSTMLIFLSCFALILIAKTLSRH